MLRSFAAAAQALRLGTEFPGRPFKTCCIQVLGGLLQMVSALAITESGITMRWLGR